MNLENSSRERRAAEFRYRLNAPQRIHNDKARAREMNRKLDENERLVYSSERIAFDDERRAAASKYNEQNGDTRFWQLWVEGQAFE
jgi:hypothetical protein